ncbi:MAG: hypothetical protein NTW08_03295 [Gammaproteobacteria bacterium]|nr:hypothetical protein [Gammaproteobacteria bacterium]
MLVVDGQVARIDFGHAFSDLLRGPKKIGGVQRDANYIIDFFNREKIAGGKSKLW